MKTINYSSILLLSLPRRRLGVWKGLLCSVAMTLIAAQANAVPTFFGEGFDPIGDNTAGNPSAGDLVQASATVDSDGFVLFSSTYAAGTFDANLTITTFEIDIDQDPTTGFAGIDSANNDAAIFGTDFVINVNPIVDGSAAILFAWTGSAFTLPTTISGAATSRSDGWDFVIPISFLGSDDGLFDFVVLTQEQLSPIFSSGIRDYLTDVGSPKTSTQQVPEPTTILLLGLGLAGLGFARKRLH